MQDKVPQDCCRALKIILWTKPLDLLKERSLPVQNDIHRGVIQDIIYMRPQNKILQGNDTESCVSFAKQHCQCQAYGKRYKTLDAHFCGEYTQGEQQMSPYYKLKQASRDSDAADDKWTVSLRANQTHYSLNSQRSRSQSDAKSKHVFSEERKQQ